MTTDRTLPNTPLFLDRDGAARLLLVSSSWLAHRAGRPDGPPEIRLGRRVVYRLDDLMAWAESRRCVAKRPVGRPRKR